MLAKQGHGPLPADTENPYSFNRDYITINKRERYSHGLRWKLGINTNPCVQQRNGRRCVYCGFLNYHNPVSPQKAGHVFNEVFRNTNLSDIHRLEIYVSGSFFDDEEVSFNSRREIVKSISESQISEVLLESRPEFITEENLKSLCGIIHPQRVTIAVGVETMDDSLRNKLSKGFSTEDISKCLNRVARAGMNFQAYLLLNPPALNNDKNAVVDVLNSARLVINMAKEANCSLTLAVQPFFFAKNSILAKDPSKRRLIKPPWLYTIALTLKLLNSLRNSVEPDLHIILGNENDNVATVRVSCNYASDGNVCPCTERIKKYLREINISQNKLEESVQRILEFPCSCRNVWENEVSKQIVI